MTNTWIAYSRNAGLCVTFGLVPPQCAASLKGSEPWLQEMAPHLHHCPVPCFHPAKQQTPHIWSLLMPFRRLCNLLYAYVGMYQRSIHL